MQTSGNLHANIWKNKGKMKPSEEGTIPARKRKILVDWLTQKPAASEA